MEIDRTITVTLTVDELREIMVDYLKSKNIDPVSIYFNVEARNQHNDYLSACPSHYELTGVVCRGSEIKK